MITKEGDRQFVNWLTYCRMLLYGGSHKSQAIGEFGYLAKYGKNVHGTYMQITIQFQVLAFFYMGRAVTAVRSLHYQQ
jgi:hypothetical protein